MITAADLAGTPPHLAFDHDQILGDGIERARSKLEYTTRATAFYGPRLTLLAAN